LHRDAYTYAWHESSVKQAGAQMSFKDVSMLKLHRIISILIWATFSDPKTQSNVKTVALLA